MDKYFALKLDVGVTANGNLEPLAEIGVAVAVPIMRNGELVEDALRYVIRPAESIGPDDYARIIPGTRVIHVNDPRVEQAIRQSALFVDTDKPTKAQTDKERKALTDAVEEAGTHNGDPDPTNPDNPVDDKTKGGE